MDDEQNHPRPLRNVVFPFPGKAANNTDATDYFQALSQAEDGFYPIGNNGQWHGGIHFGSQTGQTLAQDDGLRCIADGEVIAYRIDDDHPIVNYATCAAATYSTGFVLVRHRLSLPPAPTGADRNGTADDPQTEPSLLFHSLYMHLLHWSAYAEDPRLPRPTFWDGPTE